jgi:hypothetical protein
MRIKMSDGKNTIEWTMVTHNRVTGEVTIKQVDRLGTWRVSQISADIAGAWIIDQANFCRNEMGYKFVVIE